MLRTQGWGRSRQGFFNQLPPLSLGNIKRTNWGTSLGKSKRNKVESLCFTLENQGWGMALNKMRLISKTLVCWLRITKRKQLRRTEVEGAEVVRMRTYHRRRNFIRQIFFLSQGLTTSTSQVQTGYFLKKKISHYWLRNSHRIEAVQDITIHHNEGQIRMMTPSPALVICRPQTPVKNCLSLSTLYQPLLTQFNKSSRQ
jgi:hypothetical protein